MSEQDKFSTREREDPTLLQLAGWFGIITVGSFFFGLLIPSIAAMRAGVFYPDSMKAVAENKHSEIVPKIKESEAQQAQIKEDIASIDLHLAADPVASSQLASVKQAYEAELRKPKPISLQHFYLHLAYCNPDIDLPFYLVKLSNFALFALLLANSSRFLSDLSSTQR